MSERDEWMAEVERLVDSYGVRCAEHTRKYVNGSYSERERLKRDEARAALLDHIRRGVVPDGHVAVPRFLVENHRSVTEVPRYKRMLDAILFSAYVPDHTGHVLDMVPAPAEVPMPEPVVAQHRFRHPEKVMPGWSIWQPCIVRSRPAREIDSAGYQVEYRTLFTQDQMRTYGDAREAAGYARGLKEADRLRDALEKCRDRFFPEDQPEHDRDFLWDEVNAALRGEVKPSSSKEDIE